MHFCLLNRRAPFARRTGWSEISDKCFAINVVKHTYILFQDNFFAYIVKARGRDRTHNGSGQNITKGKAEREGGKRQQQGLVVVFDILDLNMI